MQVFDYQYFIWIKFPFLNNFSLKTKRCYLLLLFTLSILACASDSSSSSYQLSSNQVGWQIGEQVFKPEKVNGSLILQQPKNRLSFTAMDGSEGVLVLINTSSTKLEGTYPVDKKSGNSIKLNQKIDKGLNVFVSEACRTARGQVIITEHDTTNKTISGYFDALLCATLSATGGTKIIQNGKFEKVKYYETAKN